MIWLALLLAAAGIFFSAFFSGAETGFYRVTRVRLVLDSLSGDRIAGWLLWLTQRPSLFVATTLVGNNLANYLVSLATVLGATALLGSRGFAAQLVAPLLLAPFVFVYGELMPKHVFFEAPYRLLRTSGPLFLVCAVLFVPLSVVLWSVGKLLEALSGQSPQFVQLSLARRELEQLLEEGHQAGILNPAQRSLVQGLFAVANQPVRQFATPLGRVARARTDMKKSELIRLARRQHLPWLVVEEPRGQRNLVGYFRTVDLLLDQNDALPPLRPLIKLPARETHIAALMRMQTAGEMLARVVDEEDRTVGLVTTHQLSEPLFRGGK